MATEFKQLTDDERRARALSAVIVNDTTLLNERDGDLPELATRQAMLVTELRRNFAELFRRWATASAAGLSRLTCATHAHHRAVDTTQL
jgi:uncharacterized small protein (DUF1192 family)